MVFSFIQSFLQLLACAYSYTYAPRTQYIHACNWVCLVHTAICAYEHMIFFFFGCIAPIFVCILPFLYLGVRVFFLLMLLLIFVLFCTLLQIFDWMQQNGKISASSYSSYIKFLGESLNPMEALEIYSRIQDESIKSNVFVCNSVLGSLIRNGKFDSGFKLFHQMKQDGLTPDIVTYSTVCFSLIFQYSIPYIRAWMFAYYAIASGVNKYSVLKLKFWPCSALNTSWSHSHSFILLLLSSK